MYSKILVTLDGSKLAELALPYAEWLAGTFDSEVTLLSVCEPEESGYCHMEQLYVEKIADLMRNNIKGDAAAKVKQVVLPGKPAEEIISYAEQNNISLIIVVSHGRSGIMSWAMGSVANKVLQGTNIPILFVRAKAPRMEADKENLFRKIIIPLDGSENGEAALPHIHELSSQLSTDINLLQVIAFKHVHTFGGLDTVRFKEQHMEAMKTRAIEYLEGVSRKLIDTKATVNYEVRIGDEAQEIIKFADEADASLVAISHHGCSGVECWFMGSVANKILHAGNTPVLLVKAPGKKL